MTISWAGTKAVGNRVADSPITIAVVAIAWIVLHEINTQTAAYEQAEKEQKASFRETFAKELSQKNIKLDAGTEKLGDTLWSLGQKHPEMLKQISASTSDGMPQTLCDVAAKLNTMGDPADKDAARNLVQNGIRIYWEQHGTQLTRLSDALAAQARGGSRTILLTSDEPAGAGTAKGVAAGVKILSTVAAGAASGGDPAVDHSGLKRFDQTMGTLHNTPGGEIPAIPFADGQTLIPNPPAARTR